LTENEYGVKAELIINCYKSIYSRGIVERRHQYFSGKAFELGKTLILTNLVGGNTEAIYDGNSTVYNSRGELILMMKPFEEDFVTFDPFAHNEPIEFPEQNKTHNVYRAIKLGLSDYFRKNGFKKACIGLSGGIDSAVVVALCAETLGAENVHAILMPSQYSSDHSINDSVALANNLGIQYDIVPITDIFNTVRQTMAPIFAGRKEDLTEENMQSRIRGLLLMSYSNKFGAVIINTSNKSEAAVGYGTMYGDTIGAISLMGDLYKMEVYDLARYINRNKEIIPREIIDKEPSAELRPDQKDSDSLPVYEVLDSILYRLIEQNQSIEEIAEVGFDQEEVARVARMVQRNEYKRNQFCPVLKLSTQAFYKDRQMPITAKYQF
jgi:NAD+ synthase (glutamine-hydrolysing)